MTGADRTVADGAGIDPEAAARRMAVALERSIVEAALRFRTLDLVEALANGDDPDGILASLAAVVEERRTLDAFADDGSIVEPSADDGTTDASHPPDDGDGHGGDGRGDAGHENGRERTEPDGEGSSGTSHDGGTVDGPVAEGTVDGHEGTAPRTVVPTGSDRTDGTLDHPPFGRETGDDRSVTGAAPPTSEEVLGILVEAGTDLSLEDLADRVIAGRDDLGDLGKAEAEALQLDIYHLIVAMDDGPDGKVAVDWPRPGRFADIEILPPDDRAAL